MGPTIDWLLEGDPSVRWQTQRDLLSAGPEVWVPTRATIAAEGWGGDLLARQDPGGTWGGGLYTPKWTSTNYTLLLLRRLGLDPANQAARRGARRLLDDADWHEGGVSYWSSRKLAERCVNGMVLSSAAYFGVDDDRVRSIAEMLVRVPVPGGGWNCEDHRGGTHASFHTTISVLEGLHEWRLATGRSDADEVIAAGHEVLLRHEMYKSHRTGAIINEAWTRPWFPPRWHYDVFRGLDHLRAAGVDPDPRASAAIDLVRRSRRSDGRWPKGSQYSGVTFFALEPGRVPGRWNTLRALRILRWWQGQWLDASRSLAPAS